MKLAIVLFMLLAVAFVFPAHSLPVVLPGNAPTTGQTLFFDDFTKSAYATNWNGVCGGCSSSINAIGNSSNTGGYLTMTIPKNSLSSSSSYFNNLVASNIPPVFGTLKPESVQFIQIVFRTVPLNITNLIALQSGVANPNLGATADIELGLSSTGTNGFSHFPAVGSVYFDLIEANQPLNSVFNTFLPAQKSAVFLNIYRPMPSAVNAFDTVITFQPNTPINSTLYSATNSIFDLNSEHIFTIQMQIDNGTAANNYVRFQVDNNGWMGYNQIGCNCITGPSGDIANMFPFISVDLDTVSGAVLPLTVNQNIASYTKYVLVTNYVPAQLPQGSFLTCAIVNVCVPRTSGPPQPSFGGGTATIGQFLQQEALGLDPTNIYSGGLALVGIISTIMLVGLGMAQTKAKLAVSMFGFVYIIFVTILSIFAYIISIVPIWLPIVTVSLVIAMFAGVIRGVPARGGLVPD